MKQVDRTKICWNCEADVSHEATYCPFCGTDLLTSTIETSKSSTPSDKKFVDQSLQESLASLYKPPYSVRNKQGLGVPDEREEAPFKDAAPQKEDPLFQSYEQMELEEEDPPPFEESYVEEEKVRSGNILPLLFLMIGAHLFVLGALLLFCSKDGFVTLEWSNKLWFLYSLFGLPLLFFGNRMLKSQA